ncbi:MAG: hypothetical protein GY706_01385 [Bacteroides sp.]|nr:hypothetical protein [Bacteroides sp.]
MNKTYTLQDGGTITATCAAAFVTQLRQSSRFDSSCTDDEYMYHFADRYRDQSGHTIRADSPDHFLEDLLTFHYVNVK